MADNIKPYSTEDIINGRQVDQTSHEFIFDGNFQIRTQTLAGQPWFVAKDVCRALSISKYRDAITRFDPDERGSVVMDTPGGKQKMTAINESGLYNLLFQSRKARARAFRKWVTSVVLPTIRRTGSLSGSEPKPSVGTLFPANGFFSTTTWTA